jgi:hypothetical protein
VSKKHAATKWQIYTAADPTVERIIPSLAVEIGLNESIVLMQIAFWIKTSNNVVNDVYWTYQSMSEMQEKAFPYWSVDTIRRIVHKLHSAGYILIDQHNKRKGDNTQWYALEPDKLSTLKSIIVKEIEAEANTPYLQVASTPSQVASPPLQDRTTLPETPTETTQKEKTTRKRDPFYDAISEVWKTDASGWIVNIKGMMQGTAKRGEWARSNFNPPVTDPAEITAFAPYMDKRKREKKIEGDITACVTIQRWFYDFRAENAKKLIQLDAPSVDLTKWESPDPFAFLESEGA